MDKLVQVKIDDAFLGTTGGNTFKDLSGISGLVSLFVKISFVLAGVILLFFFILGGIGMIGNAGKNDPQKAEQAKKTLTSALIGFIIVFASYWIVKLVATIVGVPNLI
jgi:hypothetical protein